MSEAQRWRDQAEDIREKARPLSARQAEIKAKLKHASEFQSEGLLIELSQLTKQIGAMAREANFCDERARGDIGGVR